MMDIRHHPDDDLLLARASGQLPAGTRLVLASHLELCPLCRERARTLDALGGILLDELEPVPMADDAQIMATAKEHHIKVIPLIDVDDVSNLRSILASPANIAAHARVLTDMVVSHGWDGVELDYEHLWTAADRAP